MSVESTSSGLRAQVNEIREAPDIVAPTARTFLAMAGLPIVHVERPISSPSFPAAKINKFSGFCAETRREVFALGRAHFEASHVAKKLIVSIRYPRKLPLWSIDMTYRLLFFPAG